MRAIVQETYGSPDVLELKEIAKPALGDGDVLIRVHASSVNPADWHFMRGSPFVLRMAGNGLRSPKNQVPGIDVAGVVDSVGKAVTRFRPGDEVLGWCRGAYAEYACAAEDHFVRKPANVSFEQAGAVALAAITALQGLRDKGKIEAGQKVLIVGASGGVGTFAVQIAKALGAEVTGVCSSRNVELVQSIGADRVIDYSLEDFTGGEQRYDVVFQLAGTSSPSDCRRVLTPKGTLLLCSADGRAAGMGRMVAAMFSSPFVSQKMVSWVSKQNNADLATIAELMESGQITPVIDKTYALGETAGAIRYLEDGHTRGKVVISA
jgi:NADPH:quinone reductase-like Zn-dependent oxidoreductase